MTLAACGIVSGLFSPMAPVMLSVLVGIAPGMLAPTAGALLMVATVLTAFLTIMIGGIPAALYERLTGRGETDAVSWAIWLSGTALATLPAIVRAVALVVMA